MSNNTFNDKRRYPRADIGFQLRYFLDSNAYIEFPRRDISGSGISFKADKLYPIGMCMRVRILIGADEHDIKASGIVVRSWSEGPDFYVALDLNQMDETDRNIIHGLVSSHLAEES